MQASSLPNESVSTLAQDLARFLDGSPTPFHAVAEVASRLRADGYSELSERDEWQLVPQARHYVIRGGSTIVAFAVGTQPCSDTGFRMIGAHTDSPNLRIKPKPEIATKGYQQLGVDVYGGALLSTWLDRDLSIAGRVLVRREAAVESRLVDFGRTLARVPNLAIHLNRSVNTDGLVLNAQRHMLPVVGLGAKPADLFALLASEIEVPAGDIAGFDLCLYDRVGAELGGVSGEFIFSARIDNLASCHAATEALLRSGSDVAATRAIVLYDHEECGSRSAVGAAGTMLRDVLTRIVGSTAGAGQQSLLTAIARSTLVSSDMAHAIHPNYAEQHEPNHAPIVGGGLVIKSNVNQSYATDGFTAAVFERHCRSAGFEPQRFVVRSDLPCGSTIGPLVAAQLGVATVDVGAPMLSMHSCREMAGTKDVEGAVEAFRIFLRS